MEQEANHCCYESYYVKQLLTCSGRVARGPLMGTRLLLKAYPPPLLSRSDPIAAELDLDAIAENEVRMHARLQVPSPVFCDSSLRRIALPDIQNSSPDKSCAFIAQGTN